MALPALHLLLPEQKLLLEYLGWMIQHRRVSKTARDPEPSKPSSCCMERAPEPAVMHKPTPENRAEQDITLEPEPHKMSDQMFEPAISSFTVGVLMGFEGMDRSTAHTSAIQPLPGEWILWHRLQPLFLSLHFGPSP